MKELSTIDMHLKILILKACLNIEHSLKVNLLNDITLKNINDFELVKNFDSKFPKCLENIESYRTTNYTKNLLNKYIHPKYPVWVLLEVISFGELVNFVKFYTTNYGNIGIKPELLYNVRDIRNACAHSNCLINDLGNKSNTPSQNIRQFLINTGKFGKTTINNKLSNKPIHDFITTLYVLNKITKSDEIKYWRYKEFKDFFETRMIREKEYFCSNNVITSSYEFTKKVLDIFISNSKINV